ncbi:hypothetical protein [Mycobacteroides salmoniphilum]|uniref:Bacteriophage protein n=1 Tax=Mycobacteroides salmoniphilum TaxID=404941 RepID=A0A4R8SC23_9MYCO|nr:hypothetical protein [Mycobacteroides salmoniphilum]TDZ92168.1 hypothetical protein CCUG60885_04282 [Mycobacteroides salmoniphilum]TEA07397.1 hypothetical protein CCUG60883_01430 [Mycobacteroides salmoniphilum]
MVNALYDHARESILQADIDWEVDNFKVCGVDATYTPNIATHQYLSDITGVVCTSSNLSSKSWTAGVADAADVTFPTVTGSTIVRWIIYKDTGTAGTSRLVAMFDTASGLPVIPDGTNITVTWDNGASRVFRI